MGLREKWLDYLHVSYHMNGLGDSSYEHNFFLKGHINIILTFFFFFLFMYNDYTIPVAYVGPHL